MKREELYRRVTEYFSREMPRPTTELEFGSIFQLLVAVILSAQCTDKRVNMVTPALFEAFPDAASMAKASEEEILEYIKSISYPNAKARHLLETARMITELHGGEIPEDYDALLRLPGVGRKTANVMWAVAFGRSAMAVDTHVYRVSHRIGLVSPKDNTPLKVEQVLTKYFDDAIIPDAHHWLILHGRYVCKSAKPLCDKCGLSGFCMKRMEGAKLK
ncbi:MAG: endonuclease III [Prevotella sp.]|nr:endonuclease III [Prevotella sp.]